MSFNQPLASSKTALAVCLALGTIGSAAVMADDINTTGKQPSVVKTINPLSETKKPFVNSIGKSTYIVRLQSPSIAAYNGGIGGMMGTSLKSSGKNVLNVKAPEVQTYRTFLETQQRNVMQASNQAIGRDISVKYQYSHVFNGMAMELTDQEAKVIAKLPGVLSIEKERFEQPNTDAGPAWIGATKFWEFDKKGLKGNAGEGVVVAVLDTGINHDHAAFADIGGDGYDHTNPLGSGNYIPGSYCDVVDPNFCNDKLIGAWNMVNSPQDPHSPEDSDGHGSHTASTAAGNVVTNATLVAPTADLVVEASGVAPHANIIAYDVCIDSCPGSALLAAVEQVVIDASALPNGIQALNYSISGGEDPYNDAVELGFLNATAAGIYVATSAGNSGPTAGSTGHASPWVSTTAALTHNRTLVNSVVGMTSDGASLADLQGKGFTSAYGPADIVYAGDFPTTDGTSNETNPAQCLEPFPPGHFNGEIVICDRGSIARVDKGANVLAGGAGGLILVNAAANGDSTSNDAHYLPAVHLGYTNGQTLKDWVANNTNTRASIGGNSLLLDKDIADITAGFSSRGPASKIDVIKPDIGAPGVDIIAAYNTTETSSGDEYGFLSGTSMSSPHNAGAGALIAGSTDWSPYAIKSAIMMTSKGAGIFKEDGETHADAFDTGAGRINLKNVLNAGLILNETPENFLAANPALGGDPKSLNIASMQDNNCVHGCTWTRTVTNVNDRATSWLLSGVSEAAGFNVSVDPFFIRLEKGESADIQVSVDSAFAEADWNFGHVLMFPLDIDLEILHMPVAAFASKSSTPYMVYTVDQAEVKKGDVVTYQIDLSNGPLEDTITVSSTLPQGLSYVEGSATQSVAQGTTDSAFAFDGNSFNWTGTLNKSALELNASTDSPAGYLPLSLFGVAPETCPSNCDDGALIFSVDSFTFNGATYDQVIFSMNGTLEVGTASGVAISATNSQLPNEAAPNNILAPLWTDLDPSSGGNFYVASLGDGTNSWTVFEWENVPRFGTDPSDPANTHSFQIWIEAGNSGNIWYTYGPQGDLTGVNVTVGIENESGTTGTSVYYNGQGTLPTAGSELKAQNVVGGTASFTYQATVDKCKRHKGIVSEVTVTSGTVTEKAIATSSCARRH
ncbi:S8 family serine peptidase [Paraneptunicella aestuarii]|uniref:S8 family serine peptidase n=1 Tax=Paraneptunicella aestuarii TaxID=2831148 RepID=UPI001E301559|nr:S8 family serine peptidase [Paraneptunicella aestuarii]UAA37943.1 S8 family serine peptidase [Paraneptunicella aestuarii]